MGDNEKRAIKRLGRGIISLLISALIAFFTKKKEAIALVPLINAAGKYARDRLGLKNVPF